MTNSRRTFLKKVGLATATVTGVTYSAMQSRIGSNAEILSERKPQTNRNLVVVYLAGGNDALSFLIPYTDQAYFIRRPNLAIPPEYVLKIGKDSAGHALGLHPNLKGLKAVFEQGDVSLIQRTGYSNSSRSHFLCSDVVQSANPAHPQGTGWLGRYLDSLAQPIDPLHAWNTQFQMPRALVAESSGVPSIPSASAYSFYHPWGEYDAAKTLSLKSSKLPSDVSYVNAIARDALETIPRVAASYPYQPAAPYPATEIGFAFQSVAAAIVNKVGSKIFWIQASGYDTHSAQGVLGGRYANLLKEFDDSLMAFNLDLRANGCWKDTLILQFSEFGRRVSENGSLGTDHGAAGIMTVLGGSVSGGGHGVAASSLADFPDNPDLENGGRDLKSQTDFREVYAHIIDRWLEGDSKAILYGDYRHSSLKFLA